MTDAWGYVRLSGSGRETSLDEQKADIREYARDHGVDLQTTRNDGENTSGFDEDREEYQLLRSKIADGAIGAVITRDRARLARDFDERLWLISTMRSTGVEWHVVEAGGRLRLEDVENAGVECIHAMTDHAKKMTEIERSRRATQERLDKGYDHGAERYGMTYREDGKYQEPGENFEDVIRVFELHEEGVTPYSIEKEIGVPSSTARRIIENREWYEERAGDRL